MDLERQCGSLHIRKKRLGNQIGEAKHFCSEIVQMWSKVFQKDNGTHLDRGGRDNISLLFGWTSCMGDLQVYLLHFN